MASINTATRRFEEGGIFTITESGDKEVQLIVAGSISWKPSFKMPIKFTDRGLQQPPKEGDQEVSEISLQVHTGKFAGSELYSVLMAAASGGSPNFFDTLTLKIPDNRAASTGELLTWSNVWLAEAPTYQAGGTGALDTMTYKFEATSGPVPTTY